MELTQLRDTVKEKNLKLDNLQSELYKAKEKLEQSKIENAKLKENLSETTNELQLLTQQKAKSFVSTSEQPLFEKT